MTSTQTYMYANVIRSFESPAMNHGRTIRIPLDMVLLRHAKGIHVPAYEQLLLAAAFPSLFTFWIIPNWNQFHPYQKQREQMPCRLHCKMSIEGLLRDALVR
ncbi:hypothetical protein AVEN_137595-1 [Araneus ventricosus]|uniref:Uncharacterized protein n=1 Tax=Araneus ventricosus TaxID=182803 RepID=A0A4Y2CVG0_ARAVE|nr:hypothetical protein AVEN_137595-1 [Araneus ventricosus]